MWQTIIEFLKWSSWRFFKDRLSRYSVKCSSYSLILNRRRFLILESCLAQRGWVFSIMLVSFNCSRILKLETYLLQLMLKKVRKQRWWNRLTSCRWKPLILSHRERWQDLWFYKHGSFCPSSHVCYTARVCTVCQKPGSLLPTSCLLPCHVWHLTW